MGPLAAWRTFAEREEIFRGIAAARSLRAMARLVGHAQSKVSREIRRNGGYDRYRAALADENAWARVRRPKQASWRGVQGVASLAPSDNASSWQRQYAHQDCAAGELL